MTTHPIHTLFESAVVRIEDYRCAGVSTHPAREEVAPGHEISLPRRGLFARCDSWGTVLADANHALFFRQGQPFRIDHPAPGGDRSTTIALHPDILLDIARACDPRTADHPDRPFPVGHTPLDPAHHLAHYALLRRLHAGEVADPVEIEEAAIALVAAVLGGAYAACDRLRPARRPDTSQAHAEAVHCLKLYLGTRYAMRLSLADAARAAHVSPYHLCRVFKAETGLTIHAYLQHLRLHAALDRLLDCPAESLSDVALDLGFASHSHFTTAFARAFGITPSAYRKQYQ